VKAGHNQVLWLYGDEVIEAGTSNIFFIFKGSRGDGKIEIVTPALRDLILPGVTRDSIMVKKFLFSAFSMITQNSTLLKES
jgi:branched-chain amino acid aminotransferase